jgi:hypothetical protein
MQRLEVNGAFTTPIRVVRLQRVNSVLWQHVVLCKSYGAENAPDCGRVSFVILRENVLM